MSNTVFDFSTTPREQAIGWVGEFFVQAMPRRSRELQQSPSRYQASRLDRLIIKGLVHRKTRLGEHDFLAQLHRHEWSNDLGRPFCVNTHHRFENWFLKQHVVAIDQLAQHLQESDVEYQNLVEIGCGGAQVLRYMADRFSGLTSVTGIDISAEQVDINRQANTHDHMQFVAGEALPWILKNADPRTIFLSNGGVLEYFSPAELRQLFLHIRQQLSPSLVVTIEPFAEGHDLETMTEAQPFGKERSFSHNYPHVLRELGYEILFQQECVTDEYRFMLLLSSSGAGHSS